MLDVDDLDTIVPDIAERTTYACGPVGLLEALENHHAARDLPLHVERFRSTVVVTGEGGTVTFGKTGTVVEADGDKPILDAAEEAGMLMPSGCRMGRPRFSSTGRAFASDFRPSATSAAGRSTR